MPTYRVDSLAALAQQMGFTPARVRAKQLVAAEELLFSLDGSKAYPLDFVVFKITGYRPKNVGSDLLPGAAVQHDLGALIEQVSESLDLEVAASAEPVLTIEDVTEKFNVTSKTIQRWRRRGLVARRFIFPDGKRRVGFLLTSVERFLAAHREQVDRGANFSQVGPAERGEILRRARRLATMCGCCENEIARRIARKLKRSPLTILHTIRKHDGEHPQQAIFIHAAPPMEGGQQARILKAYRRGVSLTDVARRECRPRSAAYRVIVEHRLARLTARKVGFIDDPLYHQHGAPRAINEIVKAADHATLRQVDDRVPRDLPVYLQDLYRTALLTPARERALFLKFNYHKYRFVRARRKVDTETARTRDIERLERHLRRATRTKNQIVQANLRLVVSVARKHLRPGLSLMELVSDGNLTLMRAVESFDVHKGNKFSTYATFALMKGYARSVPQMLAARKSLAVNPATLVGVPDPRVPAVDGRLVVSDQVNRLLSRLDDRERDVVQARYGLDDRHTPATVDQVAKILRMPVRKVRQLEHAAIEKLRRQG